MIRLGPADLHARAQEFASDQDRSWFAANPTAKSRLRLPFEHELCRPDMAPRCHPFIVGPVYVRVTLLGSGLQAKAFVPMDMEP